MKPYENRGPVGPDWARSTAHEVLGGSARMVKSFGFLLTGFALVITLAPLSVAGCGAASAGADDPTSERGSGRGDKGSSGSDRNARSAAPPAELDPRGGSENGCPQGMAPVQQGSSGAFCVDRYEASLVEVLPNGEERAWSPYQSVEGHVVRAVSS